ncbi:MAG: hypothetical protein NC489_12115 [Ruminococcus flavefaciens]|nr:hypothetical protein [Ruminococcus flavefaciens]
MNYLCRVSTYLNSMTSAINSLCGMTMSEELRNNTEAQYKVIVMLTEMEQTTVEFITNMKLDEDVPQAVSISKRKFMNINNRLISHLEKIQLQDSHFENLTATLKLENETLAKKYSFK